MQQYFHLCINPRTPSATRPPHGHEPGRDRGHAPGPGVHRALGGGRPGPDEARAEAEVGREGQPGREQRGGQHRRPLPHPGRKKGPGAGAPHHCPGFSAGICSRFFEHSKIELRKDLPHGCLS